MKFSFDANVPVLLVQAAIEGHASTLYSEDMQHGQMLDSLRVVNPFSWRRP